MKPAWVYPELNRRGFVQILTIVLMISIVSLGVIAYLQFRPKPPTQTNNQNVETSYASQEECEAKTGKPCGFFMCDVVPAGKTFEETCGKGFKAGWRPKTQTPTSTTISETANWKTYKSEKLGWQISYPDGWRIVNGGINCAVPGGAPGDENTFCFLSPGFDPDKYFTDLGFQVITENNDEPVNTQEELSDCMSLKETDCKQVIVGGDITTKKFIYTHIDQGVTSKEERIYLLSPRKEHLITLILDYRPCVKDLTSNCLKQEDYDSKSNQILSTFKFTN